LDLEEIEKEVLSLFDKEKFRVMNIKSEKQQSYYSGRLEEIGVLRRTIRTHLKNILREPIKSACEFYLRYRNNPELFEKEMEKYKDVISKLRSEWHNWEEHYDKWLFNLAFKDILGRSSKNE